MLWCLLTCIGFVPKAVGKEQTTPTETPSPLGSTRKQLTVVNIFRLSLCVYLPGFICILIILFVLICTRSFANKIVLWYEGTPKYLEESVTGTKMGSETKRQHFVLSVKMVNWHGHWQVCI